MAVSKYSTFLYLIFVIVVFYVTEIICLVTLHTGVTGLVLLFGVLPLIFRYSESMQRFAVFLTFIQWPRSYHLTNPEKLGLEGARNIYLKVHSNITGRPLELGVWHILPSMYKSWSSTYVRNSSTDGLVIEDEGSTAASLKDTTFDALLTKGDRPIILYAHGNANNRGCLHRVELYKRLQDLNFHVVAFDYRSYGDSTRLPLTELGVVEDTILVYNWILERLGQKHHRKLNTPVFFWGHSLGTGITNHALAVLANNGLDSGIEIPNSQPTGLILESPFNNFYEELQGHIVGKIYSWIPWFHWSIVDPVVNSGFHFKSDEHIATFAAPVLILHARGDRVVPYELGEKLYEAALSKRPKGFGPVEMVTFPQSDNLGHKNIYTAARLPDIIRNFVDQHSTEQNSQKLPAHSE